MTDLSSLRDADAAAARTFLTTIPAEDLVAAIRATSDEDLLSLVGREEIRPVAVEVILSRLHEYAVPSGSRCSTASSGSTSSAAAGCWSGTGSSCAAARSWPAPTSAPTSRSTSS